jgi:AraC family transcriptional regulator
LTPSKYIRRVRIERAKALLSDSGLPIVDVAVQVGFADQSHFTAAFREATSMTPRTYRNATATA